MGCVGLVIGVDVLWDFQCVRVYVVEVFVWILFDCVIVYGLLMVEFFGIQLMLFLEGWFGLVVLVQCYVDDVFVLLVVGQNWLMVLLVCVWVCWVVIVVYYENYGGIGIIVVFDWYIVGWVMCELVVLYEVVYYLCQVLLLYGFEFVVMVCILIELVMGFEVGYVFCVVYVQEGVC